MLHETFSMEHDRLDAMIGEKKRRYLQQLRFSVFMLSLQVYRFLGILATFCKHRY